MARPTKAIRRIYAAFPSLCDEERGKSDFLQGSFRSQLQQMPRILPGITFTENSVPRNQHFNSGSHSLGNCVRPDSAVNLNSEIGSPLSTHHDQLAHFVQREWYELLSSKSRIDRHNQNVVHHFQYFFQHMDRCCRIDYYTGIHVVVPDVLQRAVQMYACLLMH